MSGDVAARYRAALRSVGQRDLTEFELTGYDRVGIPVHAVVRDDVDGSDAHGVGYGATAEAARIGALGEVAERVLLRPPPPDRVVRGSFAEVVTDASAPAAELDRLRERGVAVTVAPS